MNKPGFRPKFVSEYSMGNLDFDRFDKLIRFVEHWSAVINSTDVPKLEMIQNFFSGLVNLYDNWRVLISVKTTKEDLDKKVKKCRESKRRWESNVKNGMPFSKKSILSLVDDLMAIKTKLMEIKQVIGLGIVVRRNMSTQERIKSGMKRGSKFEGLPEA